MLERRRHKRHLAPRGTFIIFRKALSRLRNHRLMSVAEIAMVLYKSVETATFYEFINFTARPCLHADNFPAALRFSLVSHPRTLISSPAEASKNRHPRHFFVGTVTPSTHQ